jgi:hypothetical protein
MESTMGLFAVSNDQRELGKNIIVCFTIKLETALCLEFLGSFGFRKIAKRHTS